MDYIESFGRIFYPNPEKDVIPGAKLYSNEKGIYVEFDFPFQKQPDRIDFLLGEFNEIGLISGVNSTLVGRNFGTGASRCTYKITNLFTGAHFETDDDLIFNRCLFRVDSLFEWFNIRLIQHKSEPNKRIEFGETKEINIDIPGFKRSFFSFGYSYNPSRQSTTISELVSFNLEVDKPRHFWDFYSIAIKLKKLFSVLSEFPFQIDETLFLTESKKYIVGGKETNKKVRIKLIDNRNPLSPCPTSEFLNIKFIDIEDEFSHLINKWITISEDNVLIDLLLEKANNEDLSTRTYFLNLCIALEILHKKYICNHRFDNDDFNEIKNHLCEVVKLKKAKAWIANKLALGNQPSLRDRLSYFKNELTSIYNVDSIELFKKIINTRNYIIHSAAKKEYVVKDPLELYLIALTLETTIKGNLLKMMGIEEENIQKMYSKAHEEIIRLIRINK